MNRTTETFSSVVQNNCAIHICDKKRFILKKPVCKRLKQTHRYTIMVNLIDITFNKGLKSHISSVHEKISYLCEICNISFSQSHHLKRHKHEIHEREIPFKCLICGSNFRRNSDLKKHVLKKHIFTSSRQSLHEFTNFFMKNNRSDLN